MSVQKQTRQIGDTLIAIAAALKRPDGTVVDLTDKTLKFTMVDSENSVKVAETATNVTVTDATAGEVQYDVQDDDVDEEGTFNAYFIVEDGSSRQEMFPAELGEFQINIMATA